MVFENIRASGLGLALGSIRAREDHTCIRNITFRNAYMHNTVKGIYLKTRSGYDGPGDYASGIVEDVLFENVTMFEPKQWPIWIGPQQAGIKEDGGGYNPCDGDPCSLCWPSVKTAKCPGVAALIDGLTLRNVTVYNEPRTSPGVILGNASLPMRNLVFDGVRFIDPPADGAFGADYFLCEGVQSGVARGGSWPVPPCFQNETVESGVEYTLEEH